MASMELVTMSARELDQVDVFRRIEERRLTHAKAGALLGLSARQVRRLYGRFKQDGAKGLASRRRGRPSNRKLPEALQHQAVALVRELYPDFGPTFACEKLVERHGLRVSRETLRHWPMEAGIWTSRDARRAAPHQPRHRRDCLGELVQIDGCNHAWFEARAPRCTLLVYVDDATGRLMELRFVQVESAFDCFAATASYLRRHGKPVAFYSDKHSIFRVAAEGTTGARGGVTQFGRALTQLNVDIICANTPQAKGRVERMNSTLQDRLVKELRLAGISSMDAANAFAPSFIEDYNARFGRAPANPHDAHRPLRPEEVLSRIFSWQEERSLSHNLVLHYKRATYLVTPTPETRALGGKRVRVLEREDGTVELWHRDVRLPFRLFAPRTGRHQDGGVAPGAVVENKALGAVLAVARAFQDERDAGLLASKKVTLREKARLKEAQAGQAPAPALTRGQEAVLAFMQKSLAQQKRKQRKANAAARARRAGQGQS